MVATELLKLTMETEEERKERLKKMVANHSADILINLSKNIYFSLEKKVNKNHYGSVASF